MIWLRSAVYFALLALSILLFGIVILVLSPFVPQRFVDGVAHNWACLNVWLQKVVCGLRFEVQGAEYLDHLPAIVMAKHQSAWETIALPCLLPAQQSWVLKKELLSIPFFGWALLRYRSIPIDRKAGRRALLQVVDDGLKRLQEGRIVIIFPEGTRTEPGQRKKYNVSGALLACKAGAEVIPIAHNAGVFWDRGGFKKYPGVIQVRIGPPVKSVDKSTATLMSEVEAWIETEMQSLPAER